MATPTMNFLETKLPPQNIEAEQAILGSLFLDPEAWDQISDLIVANDFYKPAHQKIFLTILELQSKSMPVDLITISNLLQSKNELEIIGGTGTLLELVNKTISSAHVVSYANIVREKSLLRKMIHTSSDIIEKAYREDFENVDQFIDHSEESFYKIGEKSQTNGLVNSMEIVKTSLIKIEELYNQKSDVTGVGTGFTHLDKMTSGLHAGELIIVAARPSMGKTAFSLNLASNMALREKKTVAFFSLEMSKESVMMRLLASESRINMKDIRSGRIGDHAWPKLIQTAGFISDCNLFIDDTSGISPLEVRARARRLKAKHGLDILMIDYLQLMDLKQRVESRERAVSEISKSLKALAKELSIPVIALAQLNRGVEGRTEKRPMLSDLRESGSIEQDADIIMMLFREDYYEKDDPEKQGAAEIIIGKQRNGPTGTVKLKWEGEYGRFKDAEFEQTSHPLPPPPPPPGAQYGGGGGQSRPRNFAPGANK